MIRSMVSLAFLVILMILEGVLLYSFGVEQLVLGVPLVGTVFLGLRREFEIGAWSLVCLMPLMQWCVGGPGGVYVVGVAAVFFLLQLFRQKLTSQWNLVTTPLLCAGAGVIHQLVSVLYWVATEPDPRFWQACLYTLPYTLMGCGLGGLVLGWLLWRLDEALDARSQRDMLSL